MRTLQQQQARVQRDANRRHDQAMARTGAQADGFQRPRQPWPAEVKRAVREVLNQEGLAPRGKVERLAEIADEFGLALPERAEPLPAISKDEVRLIAWMAVAGSRESE